MTLTIKIKKLNKTAKTPTFGTSGAGCFDLYASEDIILPRFETVKVPTGLALEIPEGHVLTVLPRSSTCCRGILVFTGQVDSDYRGEVHAMAMNLSEALPVVVHAGDRIAQARLERVEPTEFEVVSELSETERGVNGYGSTGK